MLTLSTPKSDQCQNSPAASPEIWHYTVWRTWLYLAYSDEKWLYYKFSLHHLYNRFLKGWENTLFELRSESVNPFTPKSDQCQNSPAASPEIWHYTVWRTWLYLAYSDEKWLYYKFSLHHLYNRFLKGWENTLFELRSESVNPFTPKSDQCQNYPAASPEIWHHTVWRTWLFIAYSDEKWLYYKFSLHHLYNRFLKGWENTLFELRSESVNPFTPKSDQCQNSPAASPEIWHYTVWRTWLYLAYSDEKWLYYKFSLHHLYNRFLKGWENTLFELRSESVNPFTPKSDQCQNSPAASPEIWHYTVWRTWLYLAYSDEKWLYYKFSLHHLYNRFLKGWENTLFELRSESVNPFTPKSDKFQNSLAASTEIYHTVWRNWLFMITQMKEDYTTDSQ